MPAEEYKSIYYVHKTKTPSAVPGNFWPAFAVTENPHSRVNIYLVQYKSKLKTSTFF